jgi:C1A family cysteine protease
LSLLPRQIDLREHCSPVEDQGRVGSCVANAVVGAMEHQQRRDGQVAVDLSRMFVYFNARRMRGTEQHDCGTTIAEGMAAFLAFGAPAEPAWPYDPAAVSTVPAPDVFQQALANVPAEYARVDGMEHVQGALARGYPVVFSASIPQRCYQEAATTGIIPTPSDSELAAIRTQHGRHAMLLVGYDMNDETFLVRNSWGTGWGRGGYCRLSFDSYTASLASGTTWILGSLERSGAFSIARPALTAPSSAGGVKDLAGRLRDELRGGLQSDIDKAIRDIRERVNPTRGNA